MLRIFPIHAQMGVCTCVYVCVRGNKRRETNRVLNLHMHERGYMCECMRVRVLGSICACIRVDICLSVCVLQGGKDS